MKTITIADPVDAKSLLDAAFPKNLYNAVCYGPGPEGSRWCFSHCSSERKGFPTYHGHGATPEEALEDLRKQVSNHDPLEAIRHEAASLGMKLVPA